MERVKIEELLVASITVEILFISDVYKVIFGGDKVGGKIVSDVYKNGEFEATFSSDRAANNDTALQILLSHLNKGE